MGSVAKVLVTQSANDTFKAVELETGITVDGKAGWQITAVEAFWADGAAVAAGDWSVNAVLATVDTQTSFVDSDEIARLSWGMQNTGGVAVAVPYEPYRGHGLLEPRITVQPSLYCAVQSSGTNQANDIVFRVYYEIVKLTDLEVLRMLQGGA